MELYYARMRDIYEERAKDNKWKEWKGPKKFDEFMLSYLWLHLEPRFASLFEEQKPSASGEEKELTKKKPVRPKRPQGRDSIMRLVHLRTRSQQTSQEICNLPKTQMNQ